MLTECPLLTEHNTKATIQCHCHLHIAVVYNRQRWLVKLRERMSNSIIDVPLTLTSCSGRDRQSVLVKLRERIKTPVLV